MDEKCNECFWFHVKKGDIPEMDESFLKTVESKCPCEKLSNFKQIGRCEICNVILSGHQFYMHGLVCEKHEEMLMELEWEQHYLDELEDEIEEEYRHSDIAN